jgi:6-phosphogluconolactonase
LGTITRRSFVVSASAAGLGVRALFARGARNAPSKIILGTGGREAKGIYLADWHSQTGEVGEISLAAEVASPSFLALYPHGSEHFVYAVTEAGRSDSTLTAFTTVSGQKELRKLDEVPSKGGGPAHIAISPAGTTVVCANYGGGSVSSYRVKPDGSLSECVSHFQFSGSGPYKGRQENPHTHSANPSPDGKWVLVNDLGIDRIFVYRLNEATAELTPNNPPYWAAAPGSGPRHIAFHPSGRWVYSVNELTSTVDILRWDATRGVLSSIGSVSTLREGFPPNTAFAGEVLCSSDGRQVYVGNRVADDTIAVFDVDKRTGMLKLAQLAQNPGKNPRHVALDPSGRWLVISDVGTGTVVVLARDPASGHLSEAKHSYPLQGVEFAGFI